MTPDFWQVKNFEKYQHYKTDDKGIFWIKVYFSLLQDHEFVLLKDSQKWLVIGLFLLAGMTKNKIPNNNNYIKSSLHLSGPLNLSPLIDTWIIPHPSSSHIDRGRTRSSQKLESKLELELDNISPPISPPLSEFKNVLLTEDEYAKLATRLGMSKRNEMIERLGGYIAQIGKDKYKSHYAVILNWDRKDQGENKGQFKTRTRTTLDAIDDLERRSKPPQKQITEPANG